MSLGLWLVSMSLVLLQGCSDGGSESVEDYVKKVKSGKGGTIDPLPELKPYKSGDYRAFGVKSPFARVKPKPTDASEVEIAASEEFDDVDPAFEEELLAFQETPRPDAGRIREELEAVPLDKITMVGTLRKEGYMWGLVLDAVGMIHRVEVGNYLGENSGRIEKITDSTIHLQEIVSDGQGGWKDRLAKLHIRRGGRAEKK